MMNRVTMFVACSILFVISYISASHSCPVGYAGSPCKDIQPSSLKCPDNIITNTAKGKPTSNIIWSVQVTDNSAEVNPNALIKVRSSHQSGQELPIGRTDIQVTATDEAGNVATCNFAVEVKDQEPPVFSYCPNDIIKDDLLEDTVRVVWDWARAEDNSGEVPTFYSSRFPGEKFSVPGTYEVETKAVDIDGNEAKCSFKIILKIKTCPKYAPPKNGALACHEENGYVTCVPMCKSRFDFAFRPGMVYLCSAGQWFSFPFGSLPWPDCSVVASSSWKQMHYSQYYFDGDANDPNVTTTIKRNFIHLMNSLMLSQFCSKDQQCKEENVMVYVGESA